MEVNVKVTVELGAQTLAVLTGLNAKTPAAEAKTPAPEVAAEAKTPAPEVETEKKTRTRRTAAEIAAEKAAAEAKEAPVEETKAPEFGDLDEAAQLEAIKAEVTRHTKKGKSADIKALLAYFEAGRASELAPEQYQDFYDMVSRYGAGESVNDLTSLD